MGQRVHVHLTDVQVLELKKLSEKTQISISCYIRLAVNAMIKEQKVVLLSQEPVNEKTKKD